MMIEQNKKQLGDGKDDGSGDFHLQDSNEPQNEITTFIISIYAFHIQTNFCHYLPG